MRLLSSLVGALVLTAAAPCATGFVKAKGVVTPSAVTIGRFEITAISRDATVKGSFKYTESDATGREAQPRFFVVSDHLTRLNLSPGDAQLVGDAVYWLPGMRRPLFGRLDAEVIDNSTALIQGAQFLRIRVTAADGSQVYSQDLPLIRGFISISMPEPPAQGTGGKLKPKRPDPGVGTG